MDNIQDYLNEMKRDDAGNADWSLTLPQVIIRLTLSDYAGSREKDELLHAINATDNFESYMDLNTIRIASK